MMRERPGDRGAKQEACAEGDAEEREHARSFFRFGHVGDVGLRDAKVARGQTCDDPAEKDHFEVHGEREHEPADERADLAKDEHRFASDAVREPSEDGAREEHAAGVDAREGADLVAHCAEVFGVRREQRQDQGQAEDVDEDRKENREER